MRTKAKVVRAKYDVLLERYTSLEIGSTVSSLADTIADNAIDIPKILKAPSFQQAMVNATAWLTRTTGGHIVFKKDANDGFSEIYIMDTDDMETAQKVWRINLGGFGFSGNGINGPYETAITQDGQIIGKFVTAEGLHVNAANVNGTLTASQIDTKNLTVESANIKGTIVADRVVAGCIETDSIQDDAITNAKLGYSSVSNGVLQSGAVSTAKCNQTINDYFADVIHANKIFAGTATADYLGARTVSATNITFAGRTVEVKTVSGIPCLAI